MDLNEERRTSATLERSMRAIVKDGLRLR